ncbi:MAG: hypothetical protein OXC54_02505 [Rhodospirillaceae bacterium]|nr:hypothetical protein [Rhodospirillaceae bacterium]
MDDRAVSGATGTPTGSHRQGRRPWPALLRRHQILFPVRQIVLPIIMRPAILRRVASVRAMVPSMVGLQTPDRGPQPEASRTADWG